MERAFAFMKMGLNSFNSWTNESLFKYVIILGMSEIMLIFSEFFRLSSSLMLYIVYLFAIHFIFEIIFNPIPHGGRFSLHSTGGSQFDPHLFNSF